MWSGLRRNRLASSSGDYPGPPERRQVCERRDDAGRRRRICARRAVIAMTATAIATITMMNVTMRPSLGVPT
jgi:hypothetical protein